MTLAVEQPKSAKELFWLFEIELIYRIEGKAWTQDDAPNTACWRPLASGISLPRPPPYLETLTLPGLPPWRYRRRSRL